MTPEQEHRPTDIDAAEAHARGLHVPVLQAEVLAALDPKPGETALDCTAGLGGHAAMLAERVGERGRVVLNDLDAGNLERAAERVRSLPGAPRVVTIHGSYAEAPRALAEMGIAADTLLADLGFASSQMSDPERGLSFQKDGPLDMRFDRSQGQTAADIVNGLPAGEIAEILRDFGEERAAWRIAQKIVAERESGPITTTGRLAEIVRSVVGPSPRGKGSGQRIDPATRTFQALRIAVNDELGSLRSLLESIGRAAATLALPEGRRGATWLAPGARIAIISFHSLEDRLVKRALGELIQRNLATATHGGRSAKPVEATEAETQQNPRARSAKLRAVRLLA